MDGMKLHIRDNIFIDSGEAKAPASNAKRSRHIDDMYYAISIVPLLRNQVYYASDIEDLIRDRFKKFKIHKLCWELNKKGTLHCHILATGDEDMKNKYKFIRKYGWSIDIQTLDNQDDKIKWESYIAKGDSLEILYKHYSNHNILFD